MPATLQSALDDRIKKLVMLRDLLGDPEVEAMVRQLLSHPNGTREIVAKTQGETPAPAKRKYRRREKSRRAELVKAVLEALKSSPEMMTAKEITAAIEKRGIVLAAKEKTIAVSKRLRYLAKQHKITEQKGDGATSAIRYGPPRSS